MHKFTSFAATVVVALPFFAFGCAVDTVDENESQMAEETEVTAAAEQAITAYQREGYGKIFDTGASLGFAEFFASIVNWSTNPPTLQEDADRMNAALSAAIITSPGTAQAISTSNYSPPQLKTLGPSPDNYQTVSGWRIGFHNAVNHNGTYGDMPQGYYYNLGVNLAIAEGQAYIANWLPQSWQYSCWALDSALYNANKLKTRMQIDVNALSSLRNNVCSSNPPSNASSSIKALRGQYAYAVYTTAESWCGNGTCDSNESSSTCAADCASAPPPSSGPCPNNPNGQYNTYQFCIVCPPSTWYVTRTQTGCTYNNAFNWVQGTTSSSCLIYNGACN